MERLELFLLVVAQVELIEDVRRRKRRRTEGVRRRTAGAIGTAAAWATYLVARTAGATSTATAFITTLAEATFAARTARRPRLALPGRGTRRGGGPGSRLQRPSQSSRRVLRRSQSIQSSGPGGSGFASAAWTRAETAWP